MSRASQPIPPVTEPAAPAPGSPEFKRLMEKKSIRYEAGQFHPETLEQWLTYAGFLIQAGLTPPRSTPQMVALQCIQARRLKKLDLWVIANSYVINNRLTWFGTAPMALVMESGLLEDVKIDENGAGDNFSVTVMMKRKGIPTPVTVTYSMADAKRAGSGDKATYKANPRDMIFHRAKGRVIDRLFGDVLGGFGIAEMQPDTKEEAPPATISQRLAAVEAESGGQSAPGRDAQANGEQTTEPTPCRPGKPGCSTDPADHSNGVCANHANTEAGIFAS